MKYSYDRVRMQNNIKNIVLCSAIYMLIAPAAYADYWDYYGSGRDHPYSAYIDRATYVGYATYAPLAPDYVDGLEFVKKGGVPAITTPAGATAGQAQEFTINIPNSQGGYNAVVIKKSGNGYIGPKGEYYPEFPKVFQLQMTYGQ